MKNLFLLALLAAMAVPVVMADETPGAPTLPTELNVEPAATYAKVAWVPGENNDSFSLRYRNGGEALSWDFEQSSLDGWTTIDADGDGYNWVLGSAEGGVYIAEGASMVGQGHSPLDLVASGSYSNITGVLHPDNYLVSPKVQLGGKITFWAKGQDADYCAETFGVAVSTTDNINPESFTMVGEKKTSTAEWVQYEFSLSDYAGQEGYVAIRHYDISDMFVLNVDDIEILPASADWIEVEDVASPYTIDGLTPETTYEVQVKAFGPVEAETLNAAGGLATDWTESTIFTTLAEDPLVSVETVRVETTGDNSYYNLMGQKVTGNLPAGIYIHNGKKVVIR
jgi:hypothetical protein